MYWSDKLLQCSLEGYFGVYFPSYEATRENKHQNNTRVSAETVRHKSTYINLFLTWHNEPISDDKNDAFYTSSPCLTLLVFILLMTSQLIANDVTMTRKIMTGSDE